MAGRSVRNETDSITSPRGVRSTSSSSDIMSASGRSAVGGLPAARPRPAYIAQDAAENLAATELDRPTSVSEPALDLVNSFLDQTLYNLLSLSKSTSLPALRLAVPKLLKPRLGHAAVRAAEEDFRDMTDGDDVDASANTEQVVKPADFDLELAWKLARLRCMAYARLGDMEDEDADEYLEQENLEEYAQNSPMSTNSNSTLFLTSVLEFLGEQALCAAAQHAERRYTNSVAKDAASGHGYTSELVVETSDMMQLGREGPLSRMWRSWRRDTRAHEPLGSRSTTPATMMSPNLGDSHHSRSNSMLSPDEPIPEEDTPRPASSPSQIPLPMRDNDIDEIEVPGIAPEIDGQQHSGPLPVPEKNKRRPVSMIVVPGGLLSPSTPSSPTGPAFQERSPLRPTFGRSRSHSLPAPPQGLLPSLSDHKQRVSDQDGIEEQPESSHTTVVNGHSDADDEVAHDHIEAKPTLPDNDTRAGIISGVVGAIAGALGVEALRSSQKGRGQRAPDADEPEATSKPRKTVAEEIMGPSNNVVPPSDADTGASINNVGDFDSMHIPVVASDQEVGEEMHREREVSDPEDLALSSGDEEAVARTPKPAYRDSSFGVAGTPQETAPREQQRIPSSPPSPPSQRNPSSPSSPKRMNREAAVIENHMIPMRSEDDTLPADAYPRQSMVSDSYATAPTSQRYSADHYSQTDRDSDSLPIQRPASSEQRISTPTDTVPARASSLKQPLPIHSHAVSRSSQYSQRSQDSTSSSKLLGFQRDQDGHMLSQQRASFKDGSSSPRAGHSRDTSLTKDKAVVGGVVAGAAGAAGVLAARRQHLRLRSDSEENTQADEEKKKSLEILINSDETLHYTLTPESARPREEPPRSPTRAKTQTQELADFIRSTGPPGGEPLRHANKAPMNALRSNPPEQPQTLIEQRIAQLVPDQVQSKARNPLGAPRDARPECNTTRDLADYARSTGPSTAHQLPQALGTRPGTGRSPAIAGGLRADGVPMAPVGTPSIDSDRTTTGSTRPTNRLKFQARDARPARNAETSDLIDFIREGPPRKTGEHRIDRHVAPFRTTMDSDDLNALAPPADLNGRSSVGSAQDSSVMTGRSVQESTNSRTGLLESNKPASKVNGAHSAGSGIARQTIPESNGMPPKKRRGPRDPYAIDDSDDEALEEEIVRAPPTQDESLIDFLRNTSPPPGMMSQPILAARPEAKAEVKQSPSQSRLKDALIRSNSTSTRSNGVVHSTNGAREDSPHLTQSGSKLDKYRPTQPTHAAHIERNRQKPRAEAQEGTSVRTGTSDLATYLKNTGPSESSRPSTGHEKYVSSNVKEQAGFLKFFSKQRGSVRK